jgi:hypothetical protein
MMEEGLRVSNNDKGFIRFTSGALFYRIQNSFPAIENLCFILISGGLE